MEKSNKYNIEHCVSVGADSCSTSMGGGKFVDIQHITSITNNNLTLLDILHDYHLNRWYYCYVDSSNRLYPFTIIKVLFHKIWDNTLSVSIN